MNIPDEMLLFLKENNIEVLTIDNKIVLKKNINERNYFYTTAPIDDSKKEKTGFYSGGKLEKNSVNEYFSLMEFKEHKMNDYLLSYLEEISDFDMNKPSAHFHCVNPTHEDNHPSMSINLKNMTCHCFSCGATYNVLDLVKLNTNLKYMDALKFLKAKYENMQVPSYIQDLVKSSQNNLQKSSETLSSLLLKEDNISAIDYLKNERNIKTSFYQVKYSSIRASKNRIYFILKDGNGNPVSYQSRNITKENQDFRYAKMLGGQAGLFYPSLTSLKSIKSTNKPVILAIFEGEIDSLTALDLYSCYSAGLIGENKKIYNPIALSSISNANLFLNELENANITKDDNVIISLCLDNDEKGKEASDYLYKELTLKGYKVDQNNPYSSFKDINERNVKDRENLFIDFQKYYNTLLEKINLKDEIKEVKEEKELAKKLYLYDYNKYYFMYGIHYLNKNETSSNIKQEYEFENDITLFYSDSKQVANNCYYNNTFSSFNKDNLQDALSHDYVLAKYKDNKRNNQSFLFSNMLPVDIDNDHSDNPNDWISVNDVKALFKDTSFIIHYSRNHNKIKHDQSARPRFHVLFKCNEMKNVSEYSQLKNRLHHIFPYIDANAIDGARFFFGTEDPKIEVYKGTKKIDEWVKDFESKLYNSKPFFHKQEKGKKRDDYERS